MLRIVYALTAIAALAMSGFAAETIYSFAPAAIDGDRVYAYSTHRKLGEMFAERRLRQLSIARHKSMVDDTGKLLKLVTELNAEISSTKPSELTPEQLRKVAEIEKLARGVKDKMRISLTTTPIFVDSTPTPPFSRR